MPLTFGDFAENLPVIVDGQQAAVSSRTDRFLYCEALRPIAPNESRYAQWTIAATSVPGVVEYDAERDFRETGTVLCDDCGTRVRARTMETLPDHRCAENRAQRS